MNPNIPNPLKSIEEIAAERVNLLNQALEDKRIQFARAGDLSGISYTAISQVKKPKVLTQLEARHKPVMVEFQKSNGSKEEVFAKPVSYAGLQAEIAAAARILADNRLVTFEPFATVRLENDQALLLTRKANLLPMRAIKVSSESQMMQLFVKFAEALKFLHDELEIIHNDLHDGNCGLTLDERVAIFDWEDSYIKGIHEVSFDPRSKAHDYVKCFTGIIHACIRSIRDNSFDWDVDPKSASRNQDKQHHLEMLMYKKLIEINVIYDRDMIDLVDMYFS